MNVLGYKYLHFYLFLRESLVVLRLLNQRIRTLKLSIFFFGDMIAVDITTSICDAFLNAASPNLNTIIYIKIG